MTETNGTPPPAPTVDIPAEFEGSAQPQNFPTGRQWVIVLSLFAACVTTLLWLSNLIGAVKGAGQRSYNANVFTKPRIHFWNTDELSAAMALWRDAQIRAPSFNVEGLLAWHVSIDALLFVPTYCALIYLLFRRARASNRVALISASATAVADWIETAATWFFLVWHHLRPSKEIWIIQAFTFLKWAAILFSMTTFVLCIRQHRHRRHRSDIKPAVE